ncbi:hypothetical protein ACF07V_00680 [Streptomyces sp. NPDC015661]|uniref:hypothetical protein n=1 Tax=Streptomyces sp. NPDC015661 TaxID=3364961 RepID=UPI0036FEEFE2
MLAGAAAGCLGPGPRPQGAGGPPSSCDPLFAWETDSRWDLAVLDGPVSVAPGGVVRAGMTPYHPRTATVTLPAGGGGPTAGAVMDALGSEVGAPLAAPGRRTTEVARHADIRFEDAARPVSYAALRFVTAAFRYHCAGDQDVRSGGRVLTWDKASLTVGLVDCDGPRDRNPDSEPARLAVELRCT